MSDMEIVTEKKTITEEELGIDEGNACTNCTDYEGAIWLCGEGYLCERCFAQMANLDEESLLTGGEVKPEDKEQVRAALSLVRDNG